MMAAGRARLISLIGLAALTLLVIKNLPVGTLAAPDNQELEPVPSGTRDDASRPART